MPIADLVSVIIPTFNRSGLALEAVNSVRRQTYPSVQIIVVDDGSTDGTDELFQHAADVLYVKKENGGPASARNAGLLLAEGEFLSTIDSDDLWNPDFLTDSINALKALDSTIVFSNWIRTNSDGTLVKSFFETNFAWWHYATSKLANWRLLSPSTSRATLIDSCLAPTSAWVFRREAIADGWSTDLTITDDWGLLQDLVLADDCRIAVNMRRSWVKRVQRDNVCDSDGLQVWRAINIDTPLHLLQRKSTILTRSEKARLYRRVAMNFTTLILTWQRNSGATISSDVVSLLNTALQSFRYAPLEFINKLLLRSPHIFPIAPRSALNFEGLDEEISLASVLKQESLFSSVEIKENQFVELARMRN